MNRKNAPAVLDPNRSSGTSPGIITAPFEFPVRLEKMAQLLEDHAGFGKGKAERWLREKVREDRYRNPDPIPSIKKGKYRFFVVSEVLVWLKKAA